MSHFIFKLSNFSPKLSTRHSYGKLFSTKLKSLFTKHLFHPVFFLIGGTITHLSLVASEKYGLAFKDTMFKRRISAGETWNFHEKYNHISCGGCGLTCSTKLSSFFFLSTWTTSTGSWQNHSTPPSLWSIHQWNLSSTDKLQFSLCCFGMWNLHIYKTWSTSGWHSCMFNKKKFNSKYFFRRFLYIFLLLGKME